MQEGDNVKVCLVVEGAYPYLTGGVSSWLQRMMLEFRDKDIEFIIETIIVDREQKRSIRYDIPENVTEMHEVYLFDNDYVTGSKNVCLTKDEYQAFRSLFYGVNIEWEKLFTFFRENKVSLNGLLGSVDFLELTKEYYLDYYSNIVFTDFLWSMRSMYQPLFTIMKAPHIQADLYHSLSTGYAGIIASMQKTIEDKPFLLSEHGIYTREREEEIIKANWVSGIYKDLWINQFHKLSDCSYGKADKVTSLFQDAAEIQVDLGCSREKIEVIGNGVDIEQFEHLDHNLDEDYINVGAILRVTPIKDVKTMINSFYLAKQENKKLKLWIMGPMDENEQYAKECEELVRDLELEDVEFTGTVNVKDYVGSMDFMMLSSLSEGQPLVILEGFAAKKPYIVTNVGDCRDLVYGQGDGFGDAGIVVPLMNTEKMGKAILKIASSKDLRDEMGQNGYNRVRAFHRNSDVYGKYLDLYRGLEGVVWQA